MDLKCKFRFCFHQVSTGKVYSCDVVSKAARNSSREVKSITGEHCAGNSNQNVDVMYFPDRSFVGFPKGLSVFFPQLIALTISNCRITELSRQDLIGLNNLQCFSVRDNFLTSLPNDLLMDTPNIRRLCFYNNKIEKLSSKLLNCLKWNILESVDFRENTKIDEIFMRGVKYFMTDVEADGFRQKCHDTLSSLRNKIDELCSPNTHDLEMQLDQMLVSGDGSDFLIRVEDAEFRVHKTALAQHSAVFLAMFNHDLQENRVNELLITDYSAEVVQDMISYVYTEKVRHLKNAVELYAIASQYWVVGLQQLCEETIIENMDESNMIEVLRIGKMYLSDEMKNKAFEKIVKMFPGKQLHSMLVEDPDKLEKLLELKRQFDADFDEILRQ